jgi:hypothetical protein
MYQKQSGLILGFHGCDKKTQKAILNSSKGHLERSQNDYDWLGNGIYFWENSPARALQFAKEKKEREPDEIKTPSVLGAIIDLGKCLDLLDAENTELLSSAYGDLKKIFKKADRQFPENIPFPNAGKYNLLLRPLDCLVIEHLMQSNDFDSVRGLFPEGNEIYKGSGFRSKDHIQICIRNTACIKGYFLPRKVEQ